VTPRPLCPLESIPDGGARGFEPMPGLPDGLVVVRRGGAVLAYANACPHLGIALEILPDRFLDPRGRHIVCATHGALFRVGDGVCVAGPCAGEALEAVPARVEAGTVIVG